MLRKGSRQRRYRRKGGEERDRRGKERKLARRIELG